MTTRLLIKPWVLRKGTLSASSDSFQMTMTPLSSAHFFTPGEAPSASRMRLYLTHRETQFLTAE